MNKHMEMAINVAKTSKCRFKHGCVVVYRGKVVSSATNKQLLVPNDRTWRRSQVHAEAAAIAAARKYSNGATVYVARVDNDGQPMDSKPCKRCESLLSRYGINQIIWT